MGGQPPEAAEHGTRPLATAAIDYTDGDNSASQYALLGLHAATRSRFGLPRETFVGLLAPARERQNPDGGGWR